MIVIKYQRIENFLSCIYQQNEIFLATVMYLSTELNQFPPTPGLCILCFFSVGCLGELFPLVADPVQPDFHQFITLQQFAQGGREGGATSTLNQPNSLIHRSVERLKLYQKSPLGSKSLHTEREGGFVPPQR